MTTDQETTLEQGELLRQIEQLTRRANGAETRVSTLHNDIQIIATKLRDEAIRRDWCSEYGGFVDEVNDATSSEWLQHCEFPYSAQFRVTVHFTSRTRSYTDATNEIAGYLTTMDELDAGDINEGWTAELLRCDERDD